MNGLLKNLLVLALALGLCSCGATATTSSLDHGTPSAPDTQAAPARGTSAWIGDECGAGKGKGLGGLISSLVSTLTGSGNSDNGNSGNSNSGNGNSSSGNSGSGNSGSGS